MKKKHTDIVEADVIEHPSNLPETPRQQVLMHLSIADYSQFLYDTNFGGKPGKDFTFEGIKTLGLNNGISTGDVRIEFLDDAQTQALFYCTATDHNGDTSSVVIKQSETEHGRINPNWIEKGCSRAIRNAIKARLPIQLFKQVLAKAIAAGETKESEIAEAQKRLGIAWKERDERLQNVTKRAFFYAAKDEYGDPEDYDALTWDSIREDLNTMAEWVTQLIPTHNGNGGVR